MFDELPEERPASFDETGRRLKLYPAAVRGHFAKLRSIVHPLMIALFLLLPWLHINGQQALHLNIAERSFMIFGLFLRAHDAPLLFFIFLGFAVGIAFVTAIWGRFWCGWACPQTVFIETVFRRIETWIEGNHRDRRALDAGVWDANKVTKKSIKWLIFLFVSLVITHSFLAYFVGSREVLAMILRPPTENWTSFLVILFTTGVILFDFGWFREQFCVVMCPYGRFQSVMLDDQSVVVSYDAKRGEPRRGLQVPHGDCVNCFRCVQVCPTGIDIRRGLQLECIACTACIDACDEVMQKTNRPLGLIRHASQAELNGAKPHIWRPRTFAYLAILTIAAGAFIFLLSSHKSLEVAVLRAKDVPYQVVPIENGATILVNHFVLELSNQDQTEASIDIRVASNQLILGAEIVMPMRPILLKSGEQRRADFFLRFPKEMIQNGLGRIQVEIRRDEKPLKTMEVTVVGPNN
jgi:cytochrome c oxidase accessory protein FixG